MTDHGSAGETSEHETEITEQTTRERSGRVSLIYPEFGPVESLIGFGMFYLVVDAVTPTMVEALTGALPDLDAGAVTTATAMSLWAIFGLTWLSIVLEQAKKNPRRFDTREERDEFLAEHRPSGADYRFYLVLMVLGGATAYLAWDTFLEVLRATIPVVVDLGGEVPASVTVENVAVFAVFWLGFAAYSRGVDRLLIGGLREAMAEYYRE